MEQLDINVFGVGSVRDIIMLRSVNMAIDDLKLNLPVKYITNLQEFIDKGLTGIPALMINGKIKVAGRTPSVMELRQMILDEMADIDYIPSADLDYKNSKRA